MTKMVTWIRPSGTEIEAGDNPLTTDKLKALGWKKKKGPKPQVQQDLTSTQITGD
jgi:hypothetical protein